MPYQNRRRSYKTGRKLKWVGAAARVAPYVGRAVAQAAKNWRRVQPLTKRVIGGVAAATAGTAATGYALGSRKRKYVKRTYAGSQGNGGQQDMLPTITKTVAISRARRIDRRTLKLGFNHRVLRWQRCKVMNAGVGLPGSIVMSHNTINTDQTLSPMFIMCLNSTNNHPTYTEGPANLVAFNNTGGVVFLNQNCQSYDGSITQARWVADYLDPASGYNDVSPEVRYIMNSSYDIRLNCYGATSQPTCYDIMIISFNEDYLTPGETPSSAQEIADRHSVYQGLVHKYMANPILPFVAPKNKYKIHTRVSFTLQPTLNVENDTTPQSKIVKLFVKDGSLYDYCYHGDGFTGAGADDKLDTTQFVLQGNSSTDEYSDFPASRARKFLVVRAMNTTRSASETTANTPSFDIVVRKHEYMQSK